MAKRTKTSKQPNQLAYGSMSAADLAKATGTFEKPMAIADAVSMSPAQRARWKRAKRKHPGGRPPKPVGEKAARVLMTIEPQLLKLADAAAKKRGVSRSELIAACLRAVI